MRKAEIHRKTNETEVRLSLDLDGTGQHRIDTGIGFLDHMLDQLAWHGLFDIELSIQGDMHVDSHHTVEDCALALGQAFDQALGERKAITRVGAAHVPMDDALGFVGVDFSGRPYATVEAGWATPMLGQLPTSLLTHFFESWAAAARANLHARVLYGSDDHHKAEALFKALGRALRAATRVDPRREGAIPSTKGTLG
ncbi:MAG: imidazoleglycerol-phosphate dehydratase HisB [Anaerolineales bacterium]